ncbi:hypothetical protein [Macrococcus bovicus]|uniref:Uncharacterized protein n=1 Tax=Macrococcus bovicus TaxID=69968 RepID=A0A4R6BWL2_9STAP|nr:hypothetical protein [Macrococcus bovicus]TDM12671.1 hypothetical protein ERX55_10470 [Macrococcus bovicus]
MLTILAWIVVIVFVLFLVGVLGEIFSCLIQLIIYGILFYIVYWAINYLTDDRLHHAISNVFT